MQALKKLIENGGWRPISEIPKDEFFGELILNNDHTYAIGRWNTMEWCGQSPCWFPLADATRAMPLDTPERMTEVIKVLVDALNDIADTRGDSIYTVKDIAEQALEKANEIAEGA